MNFGPRFNFFFFFFLIVIWKACSHFAVFLTFMCFSYLCSHAPQTALLLTRLANLRGLLLLWMGNFPSFYTSTIIALPCISTYWQCPCDFYISDLYYQWHSGQQWCSLIYPKQELYKFPLKLDPLSRVLTWNPHLWLFSLPCSAIWVAQVLPKSC